MELNSGVLIRIKHAAQNYINRKGSPHLWLGTPMIFYILCYDINIISIILCFETKFVSD